MTDFRPSRGGDLMERRTILIIVAIALMSFSAVITLLAWAPDIARNDSAGAHPYSRSAIGYGGLVKLLELRGDDVSISRTKQNIENYDRGLMVLTPGWRDDELDDNLSLADPALIILPKWWGMTDRTNRRRQSNILVLSEGRTAQSIKRFDSEVSTIHVDPPTEIIGNYGSFRPKFEEVLQLIESDYLTPMIATEDGQLLSRVPDSEIFVLSDPDLANTFGLADTENARLMLKILDEVRGDGDNPIIFDATLHGFERSTSLLKSLLDVPFIGATLTAIIAALLLGWTALIRFGSPVREDRAIALGKQALTDNTAGLFAMTNRETYMAPGYLNLSRKAAAQDLGVAKGLSEKELAELFDRMGEEMKSGQKWSELAKPLRTRALSRDDLMNNAQALWRWRKERNDGLK